MADFDFTQRQSQVQVQKLSQNLLYGLKILQMPTKELRSEIYKVVNENPALEIVRDPAARQQGSEWEGEAQFKSQDYQALLESREDNRESLQQHLMHQLNSMRLSPDEYELSQKLIYNLDKNGCYGSMRAPETLLDKSRPLQNKTMLERCISRIQSMDPVGTCCRTLEESLFIQAKIAGDASPVALFLLDGHLDFLNPPEAEKVAKKIKAFLSDWHSKKFAQNLPIDDEKINVQTVTEALHYILRLNPHPASEYSWETSLSEISQPDIVLTVTKEAGHLPADDFSHGKIALAKKDFHFQVKYASGILPEIRLNQTAISDKKTLEAAKQFINNILFRQNTIALQGCAIVKHQLAFFEKGPGNIAPLTRKQLADFLGIHLSTVSRMTAKKNSKYIQTEFGLFPASYFFSSALTRKTADENTKSSASLISAEAVKSKMYVIISSQSQDDKKLSDNELTKLLNQEGIKIARRTVAKYRAQLGLQNSFRR